MKTKTTNAMRRGLGKAVFELRTTLEWRQEDLARELRSEVRRVGLSLAPDQKLISGWENADHAPAEEYRLALARIALRHSDDGKIPNLVDLVELFRAPVGAWRLVGRLRIKLKDE